MNLEIPNDEFPTLEVYLRLENDSDKLVFPILKQIIQLEYPKLLNTFFNKWSDSTTSHEPFANQVQQKTWII
jgi:hypothetical protein